MLWEQVDLLPWGQTLSWHILAISVSLESVSDVSLYVFQENIFQELQR